MAKVRLSLSAYPSACASSCASPETNHVSPYPTFCSCRPGRSGRRRCYAANGNGENDAMSIVHTSVTLAQAVTAAEQHVQGKGWVVGDGKAYDVRVDANRGTVLAATVDSADRDDQDTLD